MEEEKAKMQMRLVELSHKAGMSEVAAGVLHNVGNVLNSVNVSSGLVIEKIKESSALNFIKIADIIQENAPNFVDFISNDKRGKALPEYLIAFAKTLSSEHRAIITELENLNKNIDHIKNIISVQQTLTGKIEFIETLPVIDVVNQAIQVNDTAIKRHKIDIVIDCKENIVISLNRLKVLQILINLINNAKYAFAKIKDEKKKTIRVSVKKLENYVQIDVVDNGCGISKDNLNKIFQFGFTTKADGHGFGLHNSALTAKEMGGSLSLHSEGEGKGAAFSLMIPICVTPTKSGGK